MGRAPSRGDPGLATALRPRPRRPRAPRAADKSGSIAGAWGYRSSLRWRLHGGRQRIGEQVRLAATAAQRPLFTDADVQAETLAIAARHPWLLDNEEPRICPIRQASWCGSTRSSP